MNYLKDLVSINTIEDLKNNEFINYIAKVLETKGFNNIVMNSKINHKKCLISKSKDNCNFCFIGHSDTVTYSDGWNYEKFDITEDCNNIYGLGVADMKGGIAAFLSALDRIDIKKLKYGIMVIITFDEEIGFEGINLIKDYKEIPENILIGEPTDLVPVIACKGCVEYKIYFKGTSVHSSLSPKGQNAIENALKFINALSDLYDSNIKTELNNNFDIPYTTMNLSTINGGTAINIVPNNCCLTFDLRTICKNHHLKINKFVEENSKLYNYDYSKLTDVLPTNNDSSSIKEYYEKLTNNKTIAFNYVTEGNFLDKSNIIILGPGPVTAHEVNEHISKESFTKTIDLYEKIIYNYCGGNK